MHHLKKEFTPAEVEKIIYLWGRKKPKAHIAQELHCDFYRVKRVIEKYCKPKHPERKEVVEFCKFYSEWCGYTFRFTPQFEYLLMRHYNSYLRTGKATSTKRVSIYTFLVEKYVGYTNYKNKL